MPPITVVSPSLTRTSVLASRRLIDGWPLAPVSCGLGWLLVALIFIWIEPSWVTCAVTLSSSLASMKVVFTPAAETCEKGIDTPWPMLDSTLSSATTRGDEMVLMGPEVEVGCAARATEDEAEAAAGAGADRSGHVDREVGGNAAGESVGRSDGV